jgi:hypothetical protein
VAGFCDEVLGALNSTRTICFLLAELLFSLQEHGPVINASVLNLFNYFQYGCG